MGGKFSKQANVRDADTPLMRKIQKDILNPEDT